MYLVLSLVAVALTLYLQWGKFDYWKKKGVKFENPVIFYGKLIKNYIQKISIYDWFLHFYRRYPNEKYVGFFAGSPALLIRDPELIKHILVTDFKYFHNRISHGQCSRETLMKNLFAADGDLWKLIRPKLAPAFTPRKLKAMFPLILEQAENLSKVVEQLVITHEEIDMSEMMARYTTDFIAACGFGIKSDALINELSDFRNFGKQIFTISFKQIFVTFLKVCLPVVFKNLKMCDSDVERKLVSLVKHVMSERNYTPSCRNDFIDLILHLKQNERIVGESVEKFNPDGSPTTVVIDVDDLLLAAQVFIFFAAGFETSSYASSILLHFLAYHPEEQARCHQDIDEALARHDMKLSYDSLKEMKYLEMAFKESLRIKPSPSVILRTCTKKYTFPGTNLTIDEGVLVFVSLDGMQLDEKFYENPEKFRPARFHPDYIGKMAKNVYIPFGLGPRSCIGERMGVLQSLAGVAKILSTFTVAPSKSSNPWPQTHHQFALVKKIVGGLPLSLKLRK